MTMKLLLTGLIAGYTWRGFIQDYLLGGMKIYKNISVIQHLKFFNYYVHVS